MDTEQPETVNQTIISCDGGGGPLGHPRVFLKFGSSDENDDGQIVCPYCSKRFVLSEDASRSSGH